MRRFLADEEGATVIEYALVLAIIGFGMYAACGPLGEVLVEYIGPFFSG